jgi:hypothetical protein
MKTPEEIRFAADVMLGRLARWLRAMGYDTLFNPDWPRFLLPMEAKRENRILLTRSKRMAEEHPEVPSLVIRSPHPREQLLEVVQAFDLGTDWIFTRCTLCNTPVHETGAEQARGRVPDGILQMETRFYECPGCGKIYWEGSHIKRFEDLLQQIGIAPQSKKE